MIHPSICSMIVILRLFMCSTLSFVVFTLVTIVHADFFVAFYRNSWSVILKDLI